MTRFGVLWLTVAACGGGSATPNGNTGLCPKAVGIVLGGDSGCFVTAEGAAHCWGDNAGGQLWGRADGPQTAPSATADQTGVKSVALGARGLCWLAASTSSTVACFGADDQGQNSAVDGQSGVAEVSLGFSHICVRKGADTLCAGNNQNHELGDGTTLARSSLAAVKGVGNSVSLSVAADGAHACALAGDGALRCWGKNDQGQLGDGTTTPYATAVFVAGVKAKAVATGGAQSCTREADGTVKCWGQGKSTPTTVAGLHGVKDVAVGEQHACAVTDSGEVRCWGANPLGQLGGETPQTPTTPLLVPVGEAQAVATGSNHSCALLKTGAIWCWGAGGLGQLGRGETPAQGAPAEIGCR